MADEGEILDNSLAIPNLQHDVVFDIFSRLPVKPLIQYRSVSKPFLSLIRNPLFVKLYLAKTFIEAPKDRVFVYYESLDYKHIHFSIFNLDSSAKTLVQDDKIKFPFKAKNGYLRIAGSSNGLVCFLDTNYYSVPGVLFLWNAVLGKFKVLPDLYLDGIYLFSHIVVGFAFVPEISDFKVVQILYHFNTVSDAVVFVYTLGENCWRKIDALVPCYMPKCWSQNVLVNGSIHWMTRTGPNVGLVHDRIMMFDMRNEVLSEFGLPKNIDPTYDSPKLSASCNGDSLSLFTFCNHEWDVWLMVEYGVVESWVKHYVITESLISSPLRFMDCGDILVVTRSGHLAFLNPKNHKFEVTEICGVSRSFCVVDYIESLGLLNNGEQVFRV